jgi:hypothetical protein
VYDIRLEENGGTATLNRRVVQPCSKLFLGFIINFISDLLAKFPAARVQSTEREDEWVISWKGCGRKRSCPNVRYCPSI